MDLAHFQFDPETDRLGEGPLSEVYKAVDTTLGRTVALKILRAHAEIDPAADLRFHREAQHTSALEHPNIATIYEYGQAGGTSFIAMEYLRGRTLDKVIKDQQLGYEECMRIALQLTEALAIVHGHHLIHRDLKPANILLQDDGTLKLLDFGIARARDEAGITQHGMLVGTVLYMSPEQVRGDDLDLRSDIFCLGAVLYHVMTGQLPFPGESFPEVCMAILDGQPQRRPSEVRQGFPKMLEDYLARCMQSAPGDRFVDARVAHGELKVVSEKIHSKPERSSLSGTLLLPELSCGGPFPESCHVMAGGVRKDLAGELMRNKGLTVVLKDRAEITISSEHDYLVEAGLTVVGTTGTLDLTVSFLADGKIERQTHDQVSGDDPDEWTLQADIVRLAMRKIRQRLTEVAVQPDTGKRQVAKAESLCAQGRNVLRRGTSKHLMSATNHFRRALEMDRYCAQAHAGLAEALVVKFLNWDGDTTFLDESREHAGRALAIDPACALAHCALGFAYHLSNHSEDAVREYRLAIQLDKEEWFSHRLLGAALARKGNFKNASPMLQRSIALKPSNVAAYDHLYTVLQRLDRYEEAIEVADSGIAAARAHLAKVPDDMSARVHMAMLYARLGNEAQAREAARSASELKPRDGFTAFHTAAVFALLGEPTEAIERLTLAADRGYYVKSELASNTDLDLLRGLPEFQNLLH